jgi:hypothetical protein
MRDDRVLAKRLPCEPTNDAHLGYITRRDFAAPF